MKARVPWAKLGAKNLRGKSAHPIDLLGGCFADPAYEKFNLRIIDKDLERHFGKNWFTKLTPREQKLWVELHPKTKYRKTMKERKRPATKKRGRKPPHPVGGFWSTGGRWIKGDPKRKKK